MASERRVSKSRFRVTVEQSGSEYDLVVVWGYENPGGIRTGKATIATHKDQELAIRYSWLIMRSKGIKAIAEVLRLSVAIKHEEDRERVIAERVREIVKEIGIPI